MATSTKPKLTYERILDLFERSHIEFEERIRELAAESKRTDEQMKKTAEQMRENFKITDEQMRKTDEQMRKTDDKMQKTDQIWKDVARQIKELGIQIGGLGNKFGLYNEGLFMPSLIRIVEKEFNCHYYTNNSKIRNNGTSFEIDFWGYSDTACYIIEVKSHLKVDAIEQLEKTIISFKNTFPEHSARTIYGAIAATHFSDEAKKQVTQAGFYFISISDEVAKLRVPKNFVARGW